jgi:hypothetical protein
MVAVHFINLQGLISLSQLSSHIYFGGSFNSSFNMRSDLSFFFFFSPFQLQIHIFIVCVCKYIRLHAMKRF